MPYQHIEQIHERRGEKVALMLTAENMAGLLLGAMPLYLLTGGLPFWLRAVILVLGATLGVIATLEIGGLTPAARITWMIRGFVRMRMHGTSLLPEQLPGAAPSHRQARALRAQGPIQAMPAPRSVARRAPALLQPTRPMAVPPVASDSLHPMVNEVSYADDSAR